MSPEGIGLLGAAVIVAEGLVMELHFYYFNRRRTPHLIKQYKRERDALQNEILRAVGDQGDSPVENMCGR